MFFEITSGERQPPGNWLTYVREQPAPVEGNGFKGEKAAETSASKASFEPAVKLSAAAVK